MRRPLNRRYLKRLGHRPDFHVGSVYFCRTMVASGVPCRAELRWHYPIFRSVGGAPNSVSRSVSWSCKTHDAEAIELPRTHVTVCQQTRHAYFDRNPLIFMVLEEGLEPPTHGLCSRWHFNQLNGRSPPRYSRVKSSTRLDFPEALARFGCTSNGSVAAWARRSPATLREKHRD